MFLGLALVGRVASYAAERFAVPAGVFLLLSQLFSQMRSNQTQSTPRRNAAYAENTREWRKHATLFFQTDSNLALTYLFSHLRAYPRPLRCFLRALCVASSAPSVFLPPRPLRFFLRDLCVSSSASSAFLSYRTWLNGYQFSFLLCAFA